MKNHGCRLAQEEVINAFLDTGILIPFRRRFRKFFMIYSEHPHTKLFFKSVHEIRKQEANHLASEYYMIHPFSRFTLYTSYATLFVLTIFFMGVPCHIGTPFTVHGDTKFIMMIAQSIHTAIVSTRFFTGYHNVLDNRVVLRPWNVFKNYMKNYGLFETISCTTLIRLLSREFKVPKQYIWESMNWLLCIKILLIPIWLRELKLIQEYNRINSLTVNIIKTALGFCCGALWCFLMIYTAPRGYRYLTWLHFLESLERATEIFVLAGIRKHPEREACHILAITIILGFICQIVLFIGISAFWTKYNSVSSTTDKFRRGVHAFMRFNELPVKNRKRIRNYINFKYQGSYFKEQMLETIISKGLQQDVMQHILDANMQNIDILRHLPKIVLDEFVKYLEVETYLTGDVIITSGTIGDSMYFILAGTVGVTLPNGQCVAVLKDGMNFGEIALILQIQRIASVIALKPCEILRLNRHNFIRCFARCASALDMVKQIAEERLTMSSLNPDNITGELSAVDSAIVHHSVLSAFRNYFQRSNEKLSRSVQELKDTIEQLNNQKQDNRPSDGLEP